MVAATQAATFTSTAVDGDAGGLELIDQGLASGMSAMEKVELFQSRHFCEKGGDLSHGRKIDLGDVLELGKVFREDQRLVAA